MKIERKSVDSHLEKGILTASIVSTEFLKNVEHVVEPDFFKNSYVKKVMGWVAEYYSEYGKSPFTEMQNLYVLNSIHLSPEEDEIVKKLLTDISSKYQVGDSINVGFWTDSTIKYFKLRNQELLYGKLKVLVENGDHEQIDAELAKYSKIEKIQAGWSNPFDDHEVEETFLMKDMPFFQMPGMLGEFLGPMERGWLVGLEGAFKRGKTNFLLEIAVMGILYRKRVAFLSLEMSKQKMKERFYRRLVPSHAQDGDVFYPVFDCAYNQDGTCEKSMRRNRTTLISEEGIIPPYSPALQYEICDYCRHSHTLKRDYKRAVWYETIYRPEFEYHTVSRKIKEMQKDYSQYFRIKAYPRYSANLSDIRRDLEIQERTDGFVPDIIIPDYVDIFKPEREGLSEVQKEDQSWMALSQLAGEYQALVVTGTQINKAGQDSANVKIKHTAKWVGKLAHVDAMHGLNQTNEEKRSGLIRVNTIVHRHEPFDEDSFVHVLQHLNTGQVHMDSEV